MCYSYIIAGGAAVQLWDRKNSPNVPVKTLIIEHTRPSGDTCITCDSGGSVPLPKAAIKMVMTTRKTAGTSQKGRNDSSLVEN